MKRKLAILLIALLFAALGSMSLGMVLAEDGYDPFPTATTYATPESTGSAYTNAEYGFSITIPDSIQSVDAEPDLGYFQDYILRNSEGFGVLYPTTMAAGETLQDVARGIFDYESSTMQNVELITDEPIFLPNGGNAWYIVFTGYDPTNDYTLEVRLTTVANSDRAIVLEFYSYPENLAFWDRTLNTMRDSITLTAPIVMGLPRSDVLILEGSETDNAREYDPATTHGSGDYLIFEGLVSYNQSLEIVPALASGWEVNADGTVYTFFIQPDAVFHNGRPVTAEDVVYSWERAANPDTGSDTVMTYLSDIVGVKEMHEGDADSISGLKVIDDHTLQVTIDAPKPYFFYKLVYPTASIVDRENVESGDDWYKTPNGTGPYRLTRWDSMERMIYERFDDYYGDPPAIPMIMYTLYSGDSFRLYESGDVDITGVSNYNVERVSDPSDPLNQELVSGVSLCTSYVQFDVTKPPFDDLKVRQAFSLAFDRERFIEVVLNNVGLPAKGIYPPALPGYNPDLKGYDYDPERARQLLAESSYGSAEALPEIVFTSSGYGSYSTGGVAALSQMWQQNLGVTITVQNLDPEVYLDAERAEDYGQLTTGGWCADYPDPENFADTLFHTDAEMNKGNYSNLEVDRILEEARVEPDVTRRIELYQQAEQMIVDDAPALFLSHSESYELVKPYIQGYVLSPVSTFPAIKFLSIDPSYWQ